MPRPQRARKVCCEPEYLNFKPEGIASGDAVVLTVDEYEVIRLVDLNGLTHSAAAKRMEISRTTVTEIYDSARRKVAMCIINGRPLAVSGGNYILCGGGKCADCPREMFSSEKMNLFDEKGKDIMRIAVTYDNGEIFQHFGHTAFFKLYDVENGGIVKEEVVSTLGSGHGALAGFLKTAGAEILICGGIGGGAQNALAQAGIKLFGGVSGSADEAVKAYLAGNLGYNPDVKCDHHDHSHGEGHSCGNHGCGGSCHD